MTLHRDNSPGGSDKPSATVAVLTPPGRGAVATVRVRGLQSEVSAEIDRVWRPACGQTLWKLPDGQVRFGHWGIAAPEDVVACRVSETTCEWHCHGGRAAVARIVADLVQCGCREIDWRVQSDDHGELAAAWTDSEFADVLSRATTLRAAGWIVSQAGKMSNELARLEQMRATDPAAVRRDVEQHLRWSGFGRHLSSPWSVVVAGRPNVGKSSLINALVGFERAIVFDQPGTTRDVVAVETAWNGWAFCLLDTAGDRDAADLLESTGITRGRVERSAADLVLLVIDASQPLQPDDLRLIAESPNAVLVANKSDLPNRWGDRNLNGAIAVSSLHKTGMSDLSDAIVNHLIPEIPPADAIIPLTENHIAALRRVAN